MKIDKPRNYICEFLEGKIRRNTYLRIIGSENNKEIVFRIIRFFKGNHSLDLDIEILSASKHYDLSITSVYLDLDSLENHLSFPTFYVFKLSKNEIMVEKL